MKTKRLIIIVLTIFAVNSVFAQRYKSKPINSGFVFVDGKFIEPPYVITLNKENIYINDTFITSIKAPSTIKVRRFPGYPKTITKNSTIDDMLDIKEPNYNLPYVDVAKHYFWHKYKNNAQKIEKALIKYIKGFPNIKSYNGHKIVTYNGETRNFIILIRFPPDKKEYKKIRKHYVKIVEDYLKNNQVLIYQNHFSNYFSRPADFVCRISELYHKEKVHNSSQIIDSLIKDKYLHESFYERNKMNTFLQKLDFNKLPRNCPKNKRKSNRVNHTYHNSKKTKDSSEISDAPGGNSIFIGCSSLYYPAFTTYTYSDEKMRPLQK